MSSLNNFITPLLTDMYQVSMCYAYWKSGRHMHHSVFDLFFRKNPFGGEYTIFAGLGEVLKLLASYKVTTAHVDFLKKNMPHCDPAFFHWFQFEMSLKDVKVYAPIEGTVMFPRVPLLRVEGPIAICQMLETTLLTLINYASLMCTNASRYRLLVGDHIALLEFGLRRAQGPDGAMSASKYSYIGGFDGTSNVQAGQFYGIPVKGTHAHSFVTSFLGLNDIGKDQRQICLGDSKTPFYDLCLKMREELGASNSNDGELAAFIDFAQCFPTQFLALVDTYDTLQSGVPNFLAVALALHQCGFKPIGIRLDSGDLAYLSKTTYKLFEKASDRFVAILGGLRLEKELSIVASNDINESTLSSLKLQGHSISTFGVGTNLVTCQSQPALGCVYKLVEIDGSPRIKLSQEIEKVTLPGKKLAYRLYSKENLAVVDLMTNRVDEAPSSGTKILCRHPFASNKRAYMAPDRVERLHVCVWSDGEVQPEAQAQRSLAEIRDFVQEQLKGLREDIKRLLHPTPYKVSVTERLYTELHDLWMKETPIAELS